MHIPVIKLNELIAINIKNQLQVLLFEGIKLHYKMYPQILQIQSEK